jgi:hypothetical protein
MKNHIFSIIIVLFFTVQYFAQNSVCPSISVFGPKQLVKSGETMTFMVDVKGENIDKIEYKWTVSKGEIAEGQGTNEIKVSITTENYASIVATLEIIGLPKECQNTGSASVEIPVGCGLISPITEYGKISFNDEKERLQYGHYELSNDKESVLALLIQITSKTDLKFLKIRVDKINKYLTQTLKIPKNKIRIEVVKGEDYLTKIYLLPKDLPIPDNLEPTNLQPINIDEEIRLCTKSA